MKIVKLSVGAISILSLMFLCSCATVGTNFKSSSLDTLEFGKMTPPQAIKLFGKPYSTYSKTATNGNFLTYKYYYAATRPGAAFERVLLLEFKEEQLNAYIWWSSFEMDKTKFDVDAVNKIKGGVGKLTKDDVVTIMGAPQGKALCPSIVGNFKDLCEKNTELWDWYMRDSINLWTKKDVKSSELIVSFGLDGKVSSVELTQASQPN